MCNTQSSVPNCIIYINLFSHISVTLTLKSTHLPGRYMFCKQCTLLNLSAFITTILCFICLSACWMTTKIHFSCLSNHKTTPAPTCKTKDCHLFLLSRGNSFVFFFKNRKIHFLYFSKDKHNISSFVLWLQKKSDFSYHY